MCVRGGGAVDNGILLQLRADLRAGKRVAKRGLVLRAIAGGDRERGKCGRRQGRRQAGGLKDEGFRR